MNRTSLLKRPVSKAVEDAMLYGYYLHLMAKDLRTFCAAINGYDLEKLREYHWFKYHFNGGTKFYPWQIKNATISGEYSIHWGASVRGFTDTPMLCSQQVGNMGSDLISGAALSKLFELGLSGTPAKTFTDYFHPEHAIPISQIASELLEYVLAGGDIGPERMARYVANHAVIVTVLKEEQVRGSDKAINTSPRPLQDRYKSRILQDNGRVIEDVNIRTIQDIIGIRYSEHPWWSKWSAELASKSDSDWDSVLEDARVKCYTRPRGKTSNRLVEMTAQNLSILIENNGQAIADKFYPDVERKKDRWGKSK